jgi:hypothetical protein
VGLVDGLPRRRGESWTPGPLCAPNSDYPRGCRDEHVDKGLNVPVGGLPLRVRRRVHTCDREPFWHRATPRTRGRACGVLGGARGGRTTLAGAGTRLPAPGRGPGSGGYPAGAETRLRCRRPVLPQRSTPAGAGTRMAALSRPTRPSDYPSGCRDDSSWATRSANPEGPPPQVQGRDRDPQGPALPNGLPPRARGREVAYRTCRSNCGTIPGAGTSGQSSSGRARTPDDPRRRGDEGAGGECSS